MNLISHQHIKLVWFSIFVFYSLVLIGWKLTGFMYVYLPLDEAQIKPGLQRIILPDLYLLLTGLFLTVLTYFFHGIPVSKEQKLFPQIQRLLITQLIYLLFCLINYILYVTGYHINLLNLLAFIFGIYILLKWAGVFFYSKLPGWYHPTTFGSFVITAALSGITLINLVGIIDFIENGWKIVLLTLLIFDLLILYARFRYLSTAGPATIQKARELMGSHLLFFGTRIIIGIFMPLIFILYSLLIGNKDIEGVAVLILVGLLLNKYLFFRTVVFQ